MPVTIDSFFKRKEVKAVESTKAAETTEIETPTSEQTDDEQAFVNIFCELAKYPRFKSVITKSRREAEFGKKYSRGDSSVFPIHKLPLEFRRWCARHNFTGFNSFFVNVYDNNESHIGWHCDDVSHLADGEVVSISFAVRKQDRGKMLSSFEFRWKRRKCGVTTTRSESLKHGTVVRFDAKEHKRRQCEHRVAETLLPRVNVTMRRIL